MKMACLKLPYIPPAKSMTCQKKRNTIASPKPVRAAPKFPKKPHNERTAMVPAVGVMVYVWLITMGERFCDDE